MIEIINKPLLLHLVGYLYYWQMGFNLVFKGLSRVRSIGGMILTGENRLTPRKTLSQCNLFHHTHTDKHITCTDPGSNPGLRCDKPANTASAMARHGITYIQKSYIFLVYLLDWDDKGIRVLGKNITENINILVKEILGHSHRKQQKTRPEKKASKFHIKRSTVNNNRCRI